MSAHGSLSPMRSNGETVTSVSRWSVGAAGAHTKDFGRGVVSVTRTAAGKYTVKFTDVPEGPLVDVDVRHWSQTGAAPLCLAPVANSYDPIAKTVGFNAWSNATTPALTEIPSGDKVSITAVWLKSQ